MNASQRIAARLVAIVALIVAAPACSKKNEPASKAAAEAPSTPVAVPSGHPAPAKKPPAGTAAAPPAAKAVAPSVAATVTAPSWHRPGYKPPAIVDFHGHLSITGADRIRRHMNANGVDLIINLSGGSGRRGGIGWKYALALAKALPGKIVNFANVDWRGCCGPEWSKREVARLRFAVTRLGYKGLKISKALGLGVTDENDKLVAVDDPRIKPLWAEAARWKLPVAIHVADPKAFWEPNNEKNERWDELSVHPSWSYHGEDVPSWSAMLDAAERMYAANPKTTFVAVHFGNAAEEPDRVGKMLDRLPNVHIDIAARVGEFGRHDAAKMRAFFIKHQDRIVFGTDIGIADDYLMLGSNGEELPTDKDVRPFFDAHFRYLEGDAKQIDHPSPIQGRWKVDAINLPAAVLNKLYRANALKLLARVVVPPPPPVKKPAADPVKNPTKK